MKRLCNPTKHAPQNPPNLLGKIQHNPRQTPHDKPDKFVQRPENEEEEVLCATTQRFDAFPDEVGKPNEYSAEDEFEGVEDVGEGD